MPQSVVIRTDLTTNSLIYETEQNLLSGLGQEFLSSFSEL